MEDMIKEIQNKIVVIMNEYFPTMTATNVTLHIDNTCVEIRSSARVPIKWSSYSTTGTFEFFDKNNEEETE